MVGGGLWEVSAWRWTVAITLLLTGVVWLLSPAGISPAASHAVAAYSPPTATVPTAGVHATVLGSGSPVSPGAGSATPLPLPVPAPTSGFNPAFDAPLKTPSSALPAETELHLLGVYKGAAQDGRKEVPWWSKCTGMASASAEMLECHRKYAGQHDILPISVDVSRTGVPVALVLMAYEPSLWRISAAPGVNIVKVFLGGYHGQDITGLAANIPVEVRTYEPSPCSNCLRQADYFYAYSQTSTEYASTVKKLESITGLQPVSFQGAHQSGRFSVTNNLAASGSGVLNQKAGDLFIGKSFRSQLRMAGQIIPLPSGAWKGIGYAEGPGQRGSDKMVALAKFEDSTLKEFMAIRVQIANDANGFPQFQGCRTDPSHANQIDSNESFGAQLCFEVIHSTNAWKQPFISSVASQLQSEGIDFPDSVVVGNFHKSDSKRAIDIANLVLPDKSIVNGNETWRQSVLHPKRITPDSIQARFVEEQVRNSERLYHRFKLP